MERSTIDVIMSLMTESVDDKSSLKTFLFCQAFSKQWRHLPPAPLELWLYGTIEMRLLLLLLLLLLRNLISAVYI